MLKTIVLPERCKLEEPSDMIEKWRECSRPSYFQKDASWKN